MNCAQCKATFAGRNFGVVIAGGVADLCSPACRADYRKAAKKPTPRSRNAGKGVTQAAARRATRPKETDISASIASQLSGLGIWNTRVQSGQVKTQTGYMRLAVNGTPDRFAALGVALWIEVKRPGEKPSTVQLDVHRELKANGSLVFVVDDARDLAVIRTGLRSFKPEVECIARILREMQWTIDGDLDRDRRGRK